MKSDLDILTGFSRGDPIDFEYLYNKFYPFALFLARKYIKSEEDARDIRSKCFTKLWILKDKLHFDSMGAIYSWIRTTITRDCIDLLRSAVIQELRNPKLTLLYLQEHETELFEVSDKEAVVIGRLLKQIDQLPTNCRVVFKLRWLDDLKFKEIAVMLRINISTAKKRYARAVLLLQKQNTFYISHNSLL
jgi:RNA polymerase sigma factor (sigma-70 family)